MHSKPRWAGIPRLRSEAFSIGWPLQSLCFPATNRRTANCNDTGTVAYRSSERFDPGPQFDLKGPCIARLAKHFNVGLGDAVGVESAIRPFVRVRTSRATHSAVALSSSEVRSEKNAPRGGTGQMTNERAAQTLRGRGHLMSGWPSTRLLAILGLTLAILSTALSAPAQTPGKIPHIGYIWIGAQKRQTSPSFSATLDCAASSASLLVRRGG
jgi:hypothetical protein